MRAIKIYCLIIIAFASNAQGQTDKESLFSDQESEYPLSVKISDLSKKSLRELPSDIVKFENLEEIDLEENPNLNLFESIQLLATFKKLRSLSLSGINKPIPANISSLVNLEELYLEDCGLTSIPEGIKKLPRLRKLDLWNNKINKISFQPGDLSNLEEIDLSLNQLSVFPEDLSLIPNLKTISAYVNAIRVVTPEIKKLNRLVDLDLRENKLSFLPEEFGKLSSLKKLDLRENQLTQISPVLHLIGLEELHFGDNNIEEIPVEVSTLKNLRLLSISSNPIRTIPESIGELALDEISIDGNDSTKLPAYLSLVARIDELETLSISMGGIKEMPPEFEKLTQVRNFLIWDCDLTRQERKRIRAVFPGANFKFDKSWGDRSFYKYKTCSMDENTWDTLTVASLFVRYLVIGQIYKYTDNDGFHYWDGEVLLNIDKKAVNIEAAQRILIAIGDRLQFEDITAFRTCKAFQLGHSAMPPQDEENKNHYKENFIGKYFRKSGLKWY